MTNSVRYTALYSLLTILMVSVTTACSHSLPVAKSGNNANQSVALGPDELAAQCSQDNDGIPVRCDIDVKGVNPPAFYAVNIEFATPGPFRVYAESRRLMADSEISGAADTVSFIVNTRQPDGQPIQPDAYQGTPGLTLWFAAGFDSIKRITVAPAASSQTPFTAASNRAPDYKRLFILGDSTVCDQNPQWHKPVGERYSGWGQVLPAYLNNDIAVVNYADSGEGSEAFNVIDGALFAPVAAQLRRGDMVLIQLGHNDKTTSHELYTQRISALVEYIKQRRASPVLISPMVRNVNVALSKQHLWPQLDVRAALLAISQQQGIPYIDLMAHSHEWVTTLGQDAAQAYFVLNDRTHSNEAGAHVFAQMLIKAAMQQQLPLAQYTNTAQQQ
ncbi:GDSL-type esterase/lipase family protein [Alteromonas gilva]|uniref:GDSL-type esterase/lipase family protein n=1 Tax=Alteromonas gilva TaxID=2987522 RepID=A0ABT5KWV5_9ALTE|nr:GDSL-type esterase/lipase family protein [Alteromonas gilva]MDC8829244.1 GDSL-type esterase/lipase family protein [Alteromonas gilva]